MPTHPKIEFADEVLQIIWIFQRAIAIFGQHFS